MLYIKLMNRNNKKISIKYQKILLLNLKKNKI